MAKKKAPPKGKKKPKKPAIREVQKTTKPKQARLIEDMPKDEVLDAAALQVHDGLVDINDGTTAVKEGKANALARFDAIGGQVYVAHGVRLVKNEGAAKISAKLIDSDEGRVDAGKNETTVNVDE